MARYGRRIPHMGYLSALPRSKRDGLTKCAKVRPRGCYAQEGGEPAAEETGVQTPAGKGVRYLTPPLLST